MSKLLTIIRRFSMSKPYELSEDLHYGISLSINKEANEEQFRQILSQVIEESKPTKKRIWLKV